MDCINSDNTSGGEEKSTPWSCKVCSKKNDEKTNKCVGCGRLQNVNTKPADTADDILAMREMLRLRAINVKTKPATITKKVSFLGDKGVGKSSLSLRLSGRNEFSIHQEPSRGAAFHQRTIIQDTGDITIDVWDTSGNIRYETILPLYYTGAGFIPIVYDVTEPLSLERAIAMVNECAAAELGLDCTIVLVGNKCDCSSETTPNTIKRAKEFAFNIGLQHIETSAKTEQGMDTLFQATISSAKATATSAKALDELLKQPGCQLQTKAQLQRLLVEYQANIEAVQSSSETVELLQREYKELKHQGASPAVIEAARAKYREKKSAAAAAAAAAATERTESKDDSTPEQIRNKYGSPNNWDVTNITDMSRLFTTLNGNQTERQLLQAFNHPIDRWDTSRVTNMNRMFAGAKSFNQTIANTFGPHRWSFLTTQYKRRLPKGNEVQKMSRTLPGFLLRHISAFAFGPVCRWNTSNVVDMSCMFVGARCFNQPLDQWNVEKVKKYENMFMKDGNMKSAKPSFTAARLRRELANPGTYIMPDEETAGEQKVSIPEKEHWHSTPVVEEVSLVIDVKLGNNNQTQESKSNSDSTVAEEQSRKPKTGWRKMKSKMSAVTGFRIKKKEEQ